MKVMSNWIGLAPLLRSFLLLAVTAVPLRAADEPSRDAALAAMLKAGQAFHQRIARHGGYVYYSSTDLSVRYGEGLAGPDQIWVQPPGTPTVGTAFLTAWKATGEAVFRDAAIDAGRALAYGQLKSGGWTNAIDFKLKGERVALYRNGKGKGRNYSTLDDGITQSALTFLMNLDEALEFQDAEIHACAQSAFESLLAAQFPNGGFPQVWSGPAESRPVVKANYPDYDWRTENRIKEYWNEYTLNDGVAGHVARTLQTAKRIYKDDRADKALRKLGDFLILAQMPEPQPAWAQQYDRRMRPVWARKFEPPAITGHESQDAMETLLLLHEFTGEEKYLEPIPRALTYLEKSLLPDGRLARYYELKTNKPLYMTENYELTHDDANVPRHYGWKVSSRLAVIKARYDAARAGKRVEVKAGRPSGRRVAETIASLNDEGFWVSKADGERLTGQPRFQARQEYLSSELFSRNLMLLSDYVAVEGRSPRSRK